MKHATSSKVSWRFVQRNAWRQNQALSTPGWSFNTLPGCSLRTPRANRKKFIALSCLNLILTDARSPISEASSAFSSIYSALAASNAWSDVETATCIPAAAADKKLKPAPDQPRTQVRIKKSEPFKDPPMSHSKNGDVSKHQGRRVSHAKATSSRSAQQLAPVAQRENAPLSTLKPEDFCEHKVSRSCQLEFTHLCCTCSDKRQKSDSYEAYVDGQGIVSGRTRWDGYCPACKSSEFHSRLSLVRGFAEKPEKGNKTGAEIELKHEEHIAEAEAKCKHKAHIGCQRDFTLFCCSCADNRPDEEIYEVYADSKGNLARGSRWRDYCLSCRG